MRSNRTEESPEKPFERMRDELQTNYENGIELSQKELAFRHRMNKLDKLIAAIKDRQKRHPMIQDRSVNNKVTINPPEAGSTPSGQIDRGF